MRIRMRMRMGKAVGSRRLALGTMHYALISGYSILT